MDVSDSYNGDELIPESCLESEWIDEDEVFAILKQWETRSGGVGGGNHNNKAASANSWIGGNTLNQSAGSDGNISLKGPKFLDTGTFTRPKKRLESNLLNSSTASVDSNGHSSSTHHELMGHGGSPLLNVQIGGPVTPAALATSATGNRLLMQRSWLNDVSPPCSIMNSMEYSTNDKIMNSSSLITSGDFSSVGCLLNASDDGSGASGLNVTTVANASYNGYNLYSVIEDRQRLENLCLDDESTLTKDCNISRTDLNAIENVSGVSTMQNSYESGPAKGAGSTGVMAGSSKSSFEDDLGGQIGGDANATITTSNPTNETFHMPLEPPTVDEESRLSRTLINGGGTYDMRRPRNFNTYRKPRSSSNQTFEGLPKVDPDACPVLPVNEQTFDGQIPVAGVPSDKHTVMNSTFGIVGDEQLGGSSNGTFVRNRTTNKVDMRLIDLTQDGADIDIDSAASSVTPPPAIPYGRTFKRRPRNGTFAEESADALEDLALDSPLRPTAIGEFGDGAALEQGQRGQHTPNGTSVLNGDSAQLVQSTPFHGPSYTQLKGIPQIADLSPITTEPAGRKSIPGGRNVIRRSRNLEQDLQNATFDAATDEPLSMRATTDMLVDLETDDFDVQIRRLPAAGGGGASAGGAGDTGSYPDPGKRISLQHFELLEKSIMESEHSGIDFDEMLESITADVRRTGENDKLRQSLDNIKKRHSRINLEKQQQDEMKRKLQQQQEKPHDTTVTLEPSDNKLADSITKSMSSSNGSDRLLNRRSRYNEDVHLNLSPQQQQQQQMNTTVTNGAEEAPREVDHAPTESEVEAYDRKNRDRFKTIRLGRKRDDALGAALPDVDQELGQTEPFSLGNDCNGQLVPGGNSSAFGRVDHNTQKAGAATGLTSRLLPAGGNQNLTMKTDLCKEEDDVFKKPQAILQPPASGLVRPGPAGESKLRSTLSKPRLYGATGGGATNPHGIGIQRKELTLPLSNKSSSTDCLEQREDDYFQQYQEPSLQQQQAPASRLATMSKLGGGSGGLIGTGRYSQFGLQNRSQQYQLTQQQQHQPGQTNPPALKSPMGTKSKSYHSLTFGQSNGSGYGGSSSNLSKLHGSSALQLKLKHNSSNNELSGGVQIRTAGGIAKTSRLGLVRPSSGYFSYSTHRKHPDSDTESINSLSSSSASSRGSLYRVDSQSIANANVQQPHPPVASATRTNSIEDVSVGGVGVGGGISNGLLTKLNGTGAGLTSYHGGGHTVEGGSASLQPTTGLKQPSATSVTGAKPSGLRPPSALRPPSVRSGLPRPTSYIRR